MVKPFGRKVVGHRHGGTGVGTSENVPFSKKSSQKVSFSKEGNGTQQSVVAAKLQAKNTCRTLGHRRLQLCTSMLRYKERGGSNPRSEGSVKQKQREK